MRAAIHARRNVGISASRDRELDSRHRRWGRRAALLFGVLLLCSNVRAASTSHATRSDFAGGEDASQYSTLDQINRSNVKNLKIAWTYPTGDGNKYSFNPVVVGNMMYVLAKNNSIVALDATTGKELWVHETDPKTTLITNRG